MLRSTTKDLARAAGVSLATVDRVLNGRAGVSAETVQLVQQAIDQLGFVRNQQAANLARGRIYRFAFWLPETGDQFLERLEAEIAAAARAYAPDQIQITALRCIGAEPMALAARLRAEAPGRFDGLALMAPDSAPLRQAMASLARRGVQAVRFLADTSRGGRAANGLPDGVGIDNLAAGATAARLIGRFTARRPGTVLLLSDRMNARDRLERRHGFERVLAADFPHLRPLPSLDVQGDPVQARLALTSLAARNPDLCAAYVLSPEARLPLETLEHLPRRDELVVIAHERTRLTEAWLQDGRLDAVIAQNPGHLVRSAIGLLRARCDRRPPVTGQDAIRVEILLKDNIMA